MNRGNQTYMRRGMSTPVYIVAVSFVVVALTAGAVFVGRSDSGQIDVSDTIKNASQQIDADGNITEGEKTYTPPKLRNQPNGGLVPQDPSGLPATPPPASEPETEDTDANANEAECSEEYVPVCGQPPMPDCSDEEACAQVMPDPKTYDNECKLEAAGAEKISVGECDEDSSYFREAP